MPAPSPPSASIDIPEPLVRLLQARRIVLFVGSGFSAQAGLPTWPLLLRKMIDACVSEGRRGPRAKPELNAMLEAHKFLEIAEHCREELGPGRYADLLSELLSDRERALPEAHRLAIRLPFAAWITTNFDQLLERAYAEEFGGLARVLTHRDVEPLGRLLYDRAPFILKAHGDLTRPDSLVFTARDFRALIHGNVAFSTLFSALLMTHAVLFVGYSVTDPDFTLLLDRQLLTFQGFTPERYAIMSDIGELEQEHLFRVRGIRVLSYPKDQHGCVPAFFRELGTRLAQLAAPTTSRGLAAVASTPDVVLLQKSAIAETVQPQPQREASVLSLAAASAPLSGGGLLPLAARSEPLTVTISWAGQSLRARVHDGGNVLVGPTAGPTVPWDQLVDAVSLERAELDDQKREAASAALATLLGTTFVREFERILKARPDRPLAFALTEETEHLPWELLSISGRALATAAPLYRTPVTISAGARGLPPTSEHLHVLVIADTTTHTWPSLPGAAREATDLAELLESSGHATVTLLRGEEATFDGVREALLMKTPNIVHFAGHAWVSHDEAFIMLADKQATVTMLRPWLSAAPPTLLFLNSHYTSFVPPGAQTESTSPTPEEGGPVSTPDALKAGVLGRAAFADMAMRGGVGTFLGSFSGALNDESARAFAVAVYRDLMRGATIAEAVQRARSAPEAAPGSLFFSLHGEGRLRLVSDRPVGFV